MVLKHDARSLRGLTRGVRNVKTFNAHVVQAVLWQRQGLGQRAGSCLLRTFFRQQTRQLQGRIGLRHVQPHTALLFGLVHGTHLETDLLKSRLLRNQQQQMRVYRFAAHQRGHRRHFKVMLGNKGFQHLRGGSVFHMRWKVSTVAQMPPAAHHGQVDTGTATQNFDGQHIHVAVVGAFNRLLVQHVRQGRHLVAHLGGALKFERLRVGHHALL